MKKILFLNGLSEYAPAIYHYALKIAGHFQAGLTLLHVFETPSTTLMGDEIVGDLTMTKHLQVFAEGQRQVAKKNLEKFVATHTLPALKDIPKELLVEGGELELVTAELARRTHPDLLVMGLHRYNRLLEAFHRAYADLSDLVACPILFIPPEATYSGLVNILYVADRAHPEESGALKFLLGWAENFRAQIHVLLINEVSAPEATELAKEKLIIALGPKAEGIHWIQPTSTKWDYGDRLTEAIQAYAKETEADMIVLKAHHQSFLGNLLAPAPEKQIAHSSKIPVLIGKWK